MSVVKIKICKKSFLLEADPFTMKLTPRFSADKALLEPKKISKINENTFLLEDDIGTVIVEFNRYDSTTLIRVRSDGRYTCTGIPLIFTIEELEADKYLAFQFSHDPPGYFSKEEEFDYPVLKDVGQNDYCAWSYPIHLDSLNLPTYYKVSQLILHKDDTNMFILPISNMGFRAIISLFKDRNFSIILEAKSKKEWDNLYVFALTTGKDVYKIIEKTYSYVFSEINKEHLLRRNKELPEIFRYLGWCSWNSLYHNVSSEKVMKIIKDILNKGVKISYVLIDDGWQKLNDNKQVQSFEPDPIKFPEGFYEFSLKIKKLGVKWVGLWHTINVYWRGIDPESVLAKKMIKLLEYGKSGLIPMPEKAYDFFNYWYSLLNKWNIDFVKVDNQSSIGYEYEGKYPIEKAASEIHKGLESAGYVNNISVLNCMAMQPENVFNWYKSSVSRNSMDYIPGIISRGKLHLYFNAYNSLWMSQVVWPDWDMFQSNDPLALQHVVARAISGGPIYFTDEEGATNPEVLKPLTFSDGRLPGPDTPAIPTDDMIFHDPYNENFPLKLYTYVDVKGIGRYYIVAAFNINKNDNVVKLRLDPSTFIGKQSVIYEYFSKKIYHGTIHEELSKHETRLYIISPINKWLAPFGLESIYIMPRSLIDVKVFDDEAIVNLYETGEIVIYSLNKIKEIEGGRIIENNNVLKIEAEEKVLRLKIY